MNTGRVDAIGFNEKPMKGFGSIHSDDKNLKKILNEELIRQLSGNQGTVAYMPDIGNLLNGSKGFGQAATQV